MLVRGSTRENKTGTSKVGAISKAQKPQSFLNLPGTILNEKKVAFRARMTLQKFRQIYSVLRQMVAFVFEHPPPLQ